MYHAIKVLIIFTSWRAVDNLLKLMGIHSIKHIYKWRLNNKQAQFFANCCTKSGKFESPSKHTWQKLLQRKWITSQRVSIRWALYPDCYAQQTTMGWPLVLISTATRPTWMLAIVRPNGKWSFKAESAFLVKIAQSSLIFDERSQRKTE